MTAPHIAAKAPMPVDVKAGKTYYWCACGQSKTQPWCDGSVGMMGISWGGFNGLQIAARRPPALKAIVTICSTDDRYADDAHYMGGIDADNPPSAQEACTVLLSHSPLAAGSGGKLLMASGARRGGGAKRPRESPRSIGTGGLP